MLEVWLWTPPRLPVCLCLPSTGTLLLGTAPLQEPLPAGTPAPVQQTCSEPEPQAARLTHMSQTAAAFGRWAVPRPHGKVSKLAMPLTNLSMFQSNT